jgi:hypothetical protein
MSIRRVLVVQLCALTLAAGAWVACGSDGTATPSPDSGTGSDSGAGSDTGTGSDTGSGADSSDAGTGSDTSDSATAPVVVYSSDFETSTTGFDVTQTSSLPKDADGGVSTYLGQRTPGTTSAVLTLNGLKTGKVYRVAFDAYVGGTWDGSGSFGPDFFTVTSSSSGVLVHATFRNGFPIGDTTPAQSYADNAPVGDGGALFRTREGSDVELAEPIYYFGHGAGNPVLSFTAAGSTETISFLSVDQQGVGDEFFALDNVVVTEAP